MLSYSYSLLGARALAYHAHGGLAALVSASQSATTWECWTRVENALGVGLISIELDSNRIKDRFKVFDHFSRCFKSANQFSNQIGSILLDVDVGFGSLQLVAFLKLLPAYAKDVVDGVDYLADLLGILIFSVDFILEVLL